MFHIKADDEFANANTEYLDKLVGMVQGMEPVAEYGVVNSRTTKALMYLLPKHEFVVYTDDYMGISNSMKNLKLYDGTLQRIRFVKQDILTFPEHDYFSLTHSYGYLNTLTDHEVRTFLLKCKNNCTKMCHLVKGVEYGRKPDNERYFYYSDIMQLCKQLKMRARNFNYKYYLIEWSR